VREARVEAAPHAGVPAHEIARFEQQIEKVERAGAGLQRLVTLDRVRELLLERGRKVGVGVEPEPIELRFELVAGVDDSLPRDARLVSGSAAMAYF